MNQTQKLLSEIVVYNKYAKYLPSLKRRETWGEIIGRYLQMLIDRYGTKEDSHLFSISAEVGGVDTDRFSNITQQILSNGQYLYDKKVLPSMRALQFAGPAIEKNEARIYNCAYLPIDDYRAFNEIMFLLLGGTGVGYSVQKNHIEKLPTIQKPVTQSKYLIGDSIEGWADALKQLMKSYFGVTKVKPRFDYSDIRPKGSRLVTAGGKAPGPQPLKICLTQIEAMLDEKINGDRLTSLEVHDICCYIADAVLAGGIRRAAMISLFSLDDKEMATCKHGEWWIENPQRGRANNSSVILRNRIKENEFYQLWQMVQDSNSGEPGIYFTDDPNYGTNPCCEISLRPFTFCNLTEINAGNIGEGFQPFSQSPDWEKVEKSDSIYEAGMSWADDVDKEYTNFRQNDFNERARVAAFFGTLQTGFTDFHYLRPIWRKNTEKDNLIGVGITGICNGNIDDLNLFEATTVVKEENKRVANIIGVGIAARTTTIKPSGTTSCVVGTSSGIHAWQSQRYIRNIQCRVGDELYNFFTTYHSELIKVMEYDPHSAVIGIPQIAPSNATIRDDEDALFMLQRVNRFNLEWVKSGHRSGPNTNNVSATVSIDRDRIYDATEEEIHRITDDHISGLVANEWDVVGTWMWDNRFNFNGLSVLPYHGGNYKDQPFEEIPQEDFERKLNYINNNTIDLTLILEEEDNTTQKQNLACSGGACEVV